MGSNDAELWLDFEVQNNSSSTDLTNLQVTIEDVAHDFLLDASTGQRGDHGNGLADWSPVRARWGDKNPPGDSSNVTIPKNGGKRRFRLAYARQGANRANLSYEGESQNPASLNVRLLPEGPARVDLVIDSPQLGRPVARPFMAHLTRPPATMEGTQIRLPPRGMEHFEAEPWNDWWAAKLEADREAHETFVAGLDLAMEEGRALLKRASGSKRSDPAFLDDYPGWAERGEVFIRMHVGRQHSAAFKNAVTGRAPAGQTHLDFLAQAEEIVAKLGTLNEILTRDREGWT